MATKEQLATANIYEFKKHVELALQETKSKLRPTVTEQATEGEASALVEVFKPTEAHEIVGDMPDTIYNATDQDRRWVGHSQFGWAERIDPFATLDSGINPLLPYASLATAAMHRKQDEAILKGMLGVNKKGKIGAETEFFSKENILSAVEGDDFFKTFIGQLITAKSIFRKRYIDVDSEQVYVLVPSDVWASLFALERATSKDYINTAALQAGKIEAFAGVWFINMEKVPGNDLFPVGTKFPGLIDGKVEYPNGKPTVKSSAKFEDTKIKYVLPIYCKSAVVFTQRKAIDVQHSKDPGKWHAPQITLTSSFGATRIEPDKILGIEISKDSLKGVPVLKGTKAA
ncbi:phage capsid protein (plasmid) [Candidatus Liberibacter asiaticus]